MVEIKDSGREFHWSRPRIMGLVFGAVASPIFVALAAFGHETLGGVLWFATCIGLTDCLRPTDKVPEIYAAPDPYVRRTGRKTGF